MNGVLAVMAGKLTLSICRLDLRPIAKCALLRSSAKQARKSNTEVVPRAGNALATLLKDMGRDQVVATSVWPSRC
jgi:hypothetical protein